jgi:hypothetical protein
MSAYNITVGSSDVGVILGLGMWADATPMSVWSKMIGLAKSQTSAAKERGHIIEPALLLWWEQKHGNGRVLTRCPPYHEGPPVVRDGWMHARWDGLIPNTLIVEAKSTRYFDEEEGWGEDGSSRIPACYQAQLAWQMAVLDVPEAELIAFATYSNEVRRFVGFKRNKNLEDALIAKVKAWMEAHVWCYPEVWNPPGEATYDVVSARFIDGGKDELVWVEPRQEDFDLARAYADAHARENAAKAEKERIKTLLCERIGDAYGISKIATWAHGTSPSRIDTAKLAAEFPEVHAACLVPGEPTRRFNLKWKDPDAPKTPRGKKNQDKETQA